MILFRTKGEFVYDGKLVPWLLVGATVGVLEGVEVGSNVGATLI